MPTSLADVELPLPTAAGAVEIAAAGGHHLLVLGGAGCAKELGTRVVQLRRSLTATESGIVRLLYDLADLEDELVQLDNGLRPPFRVAQPDIATTELLGPGGDQAVIPGEASLAHHGILVLDGLLGFSADVLSELWWITGDKHKQEMNIGRVVDKMIPRPGRAARSHYLPAWFCLVASMVHSKGADVPRLVGRMELCVPAADLDWKNRATMASKRVQAAQQVQWLRLGKIASPVMNAAMTPAMIDRFCVLDDDEARRLLDAAYDELDLTARSLASIRKVARTAADLEGSDRITTEHLAEAISYAHRFRPTQPQH